MLRNIALISLFVAVVAWANTYTPGQGEQPVLGKMRSNFIAAPGPNQKMISILDLDGTFVKSITESGSDYLFTFQNADNTEGTMTISVSGTGRTDAQIQAIVGGMVTANTETGGIRIDYDQGTQKLNIFSALPDTALAIRDDMLDSLLQVRGDMVAIPDPSAARDGRILTVSQDDDGINDGVYVLAENTGSGSAEMASSAIGAEWARTNNLRTGTHNTNVNNIQWTVDADAPTGSRAQILSGADQLYIVRENLPSAVVGLWVALYANGISAAPDPTRLFIEFSAETDPEDRFLLFTDPSGDAPDEASITFSVIPNRFDTNANKVATIISIRVTSGTGDILPDGAYIAVHPAVAAGGTGLTQQQLTDAVTPLQQADVSLGGRIDNEEDARVAADMSFGQQLGAFAAVTAEVFPSEITNIDALEQSFTVAFDPIKGGSLPTGTTSVRVLLQSAQHTTATINANTRYMAISVDNAELLALKNSGRLTNATTHVNLSFLFTNASGTVVGTAASSIQINDNNFPQSKRAADASVASSIAAEETRATAALNAMRDQLSTVDQGISDEVEALRTRLSSEELKTIDTPHRGTALPVNPKAGDLFYLTEEIIIAPSAPHSIAIPSLNRSDLYGFTEIGGIGPSSLIPDNGRRSIFDLSLGTGTWVDANFSGNAYYFLEISGSTNDYVRKWTNFPRRRDPSGDITLPNGDWRGIFTTENHVFVINGTSRSVNAFDRTSGAAATSHNITLPAGSYHTAIKSGQLILFPDSGAGQVIVYSVNTNGTLRRRSSLDFSLGTGVWTASAYYQLEKESAAIVYFYNSVTKMAQAWKYQTQNYDVAPTRSTRYDIDLSGQGTYRGLLIDGNILFAVNDIDGFDRAEGWLLSILNKPPVLGTNQLAAAWFPKSGQPREGRLHVAYNVSWPTGGAALNQIDISLGQHYYDYSTRALVQIGSDITVGTNTFRVMAERDENPTTKPLLTNVVNGNNIHLGLHFSSIGYATEQGTFTASQSRSAGDYRGTDDGHWARWYPPADETSAGISEEDQEKLDRYGDNPAANPSTHTGDFVLISPYTNIIYAPATATSLSLDAGEIMVGSGVHDNSILIHLAAIDAEAGDYISEGVIISIETASNVIDSGILTNVANPGGENKYVIGVQGDFTAIAAYTGNVTISFVSKIAQSLAAAQNPPVASREEAIAGTATDPRLWSPEQVKTAVQALAAPVTSDNFGGPHLPNAIYEGQEFLLTANDVTGGAHEHSATFYPVVLGTGVAGHSLVSLRGAGIPYNVLGTPTSQLPNFPDIFNAARLVAVVTRNEEQHYIFRETGLTVGGVVYTPTHVRYNYRASSGRAGMNLISTYTIGGNAYRDYGAVGAVVDPSETVFGPWTFSIEFSGDDGSKAFLDTDGTIDATAPVSFAAGRYAASGSPLRWFKMYLAREPNVLVAWNISGTAAQTLTLPANYALWDELHLIYEDNNSSEEFVFFPTSAFSANFSSFGEKC